MYTVYRTTNILTGHFYIGVHKTENPNDSYLGSGLAIKAAIKQLGKSAFKKEIIECFDDARSAYALENKLVTKKLVKDPNCYNLTVGGIPTADWFEKRKVHYRRNVKTFLGKKHSEESKKKISDSSKGKIPSKETREKISKANKGRRFPNRGPQTSEANSKRSSAHLNLDKVVCPKCSKSVSPQNAKRWHFDNCKPRRARYAKDRSV